MRSKPLVSILIPCYNAQPWIGQCIQSALDQTWPSKEIIVIDDGSTDGSAGVIRSFGSDIVFRQCSHSGGNVVRNALAELARGEWLQYLDADDFLSPGKVASQLASVEQSAAEFDVVYSPVIIHDENRPGADCVLSIDDNDETLTFIRWGPLNTGGLLLRRQTVLDAGLWNVERRFCQEHDLVLRLILRDGRFFLHRNAEAVYRRHGSNTVSRRDPLGVIRLRMELTDRLADYLKSEGRWTPTHSQALYVARMECARSAARTDFRYAEELGAKAAALGARWVSSSPALPPHYQAISRIVGFKYAERLAGFVRGRKTIAL